MDNNKQITIEVTKLVVYLGALALSTYVVASVWKSVINKKDK